MFHRKRTSRLLLVCALLAQPNLRAQESGVPSTATPTSPAAKREAPSLLTQAALQRQQGKTADAEASLQRALNLDPASIPANDLNGNLLLDSQRLPEAMDHFEAALATNPHDEPARTGERTAAIALALRTRAAGEAEGALQCLQRALAFLPNDPELLLDTGIQALNLHRLALAHHALQAALNLDPANAKTLYALARVEVEQEHFAEAETHFKAYLEQHPNDATAHYGLGHLYQVRQQIDQAKQQFAQSIALQPIQTEAYYQLAQMALDAHHDDEARAAYAKTLARMDTHAGALTGMGILAYRAKDYPAAAPYLQSAIAAAPDYQPAHYYLGLTLRRLGKQQEAERELATAVALATQQQGKSQPIQAP